MGWGVRSGRLWTAFQGRAILTLSIGMLLDGLCTSHLVRDQDERMEAAPGPAPGAVEAAGHGGQAGSAHTPCPEGTLPGWPVGHLLVAVLVVAGCML